MEPLILNKIGAVVVMLCLALISGSLPIWLRNIIIKSSYISEKKTQITLSALLCFGAGVLMATVFLHILKETRFKFEELMKENIIIDMDYPISELSLCMGFFLIYILEEVVRSCIDHTHSEENDLRGDNFQRAPSISAKNISNLKREGLNQNIIKEERKIKSNANNNSDHNRIQEVDVECSCSQDKEVSKFREENSDVENCTSNSTTKLNSVKHGSSANGVIEVSIARSVLVVFALSLHGVFEGLSLGLEDNVKDVWLLCAALSAHKIFIVFSIGMELLEVGVERFIYAAHILVFSIASPVGVMVGAVLRASFGEQEATGRIIIAALQGISGGTILYVTFCEVLERERVKLNGRFTRLWALILGFALLAGIEALGGHSHEHDSFLTEPNSTIGVANANDYHTHDH